MKTTPLSLCSLAMLGWTFQLTAFSQNQIYTMHEWGTFTTVMGSDGTHLDGVEREDAPLPKFVYQLDDLHPVNDGTTKGLDYSRTLSHVNVRMETPVIYFYTDQAFDAQVDVEFIGGTIGQWFPDRSGGEVWPQERNLDYASKRTGSIRWNVRVEPAGEDQFERVFQGGELPCWLHPRQTDSALVTNARGQTDKYLFYRGLGRLDLPLACSATNVVLKASSKGPEAIEQWLVFELNEQHEARWWVPETLAPGTDQSVNLTSQSFRADWKKILYQDGLKFLMKAGLYRKEADAMLQTWWNDYFGKPGLRVFWLVPGAYLEKVLPLHISPTPSQSARVMVGRAEILTPAFEKRLSDDFAQVDTGRPNPWQEDRFFPAYANRVLQLRATVETKSAELAAPSVPLQSSN